MYIDKHRITADVENDIYTGCGILFHTGDVAYCGCFTLIGVATYFVSAKTPTCARAGRINRLIIPGYYTYASSMCIATKLWVAMHS